MNDAGPALLVSFLLKLVIDETLDELSLINLTILHSLQYRLKSEGRGAGTAFLIHRFSDTMRKAEELITASVTQRYSDLYRRRRC